MLLKTFAKSVSSEQQVSKTLRIRQPVQQQSILSVTVQKILGDFMDKSSKLFTHISCRTINTTKYYYRCIFTPRTVK